MKRKLMLLFSSMILVSVISGATGCSGQTNTQTEATVASTSETPESSSNTAINDFGYNIIVMDKDGKVDINTGDNSQQFLPASPFKLITSAILLDSKTVTKDEKLTEDVSNGLFCAIHKENTDETLGEAINNNCIPLFVEYGDKVDKTVVNDYSKKFGFGDNLADNENWAIGQGLAVTSEQLAKAFTIFANDGADSTGQSVISSDTASTVKSYLKDAIHNGNNAELFKDNTDIMGMFGNYNDRATGSAINDFVGIVGDKVVVVVDNNNTEDFQKNVSEIVKNL